MGKKYSLVMAGLLDNRKTLGVAQFEIPSPGNILNSAGEVFSGMRGAAFFAKVIRL